MLDRRINWSLHCFVATILVLGAIGLEVAIIFGLDPRFGFAAIQLGIFAGVVRVRGWFCALTEREHNAFTLGADSERERLHAVN